MTGTRDRKVLSLLLLAPAFLLALLWINGRTLFWGDLTYINHPWRTLAAEMTQRGLLPLWNPYAYLGMPLAAQMQSGIWYPGSLPFVLFPFVTSLFLFYALHFALGGLFCYLWLRQWRLSPWASAAGTAVFIGNGVWISHILFPNQLAGLSYMPAFLLFRKNRWLLGITLALCFLSGYPTTLIGGVLAAILLGVIEQSLPSPSLSPDRMIVRAYRWARVLPAAALLSLGLSACLLFPAVTLAVHSQRGAGLDMEQIFRFAFSFSDLIQWFSPLALRAEQFSPPILWWKTCYLGLAAWAAVVLAMTRLRIKAGCVVTVHLAAVTLLVLGDSNPLSRWFWTHCGPLHYIRYPGNLAYLALPAFALLVAVGLHRRRAAAPWACLIIAELSLYATNGQPVISRNYFSDKGPLIRNLQQSLDGHRYLLSSGALESTQGVGKDITSSMFDWKHRLYGVSNIPYHLSSVGNFGEPLVPADNYHFMDFIYRLGMQQAAIYLPWSDAKFLLTKTKQPPGSLRYKGENLWHQYEVFGTLSRSLWFDEASGSAIPAEIDVELQLPAISKAKALPWQGEGRSPYRQSSASYSSRWQGETRWMIQAQTQAGWLYIAEPKDSGWKLWLNGRLVQSERAMGVFQKLRVPEGFWELRAAYHPESWTWGLMLTLLTLIGTIVYWYHCLENVAMRRRDL